MTCFNNKIVDQLSHSLKNEVIINIDEIIDNILDDILEEEVIN